MAESNSVGKLDEWTMNPFLSEVQLQCTLALYGIQQSKEALEAILTMHIDRKSDKLEELEEQRLWNGLQSALVSTANLSKLLWPAGPRCGEDTQTTQRRERRGKWLREVLDVPDNSVIRDKCARNSVEHFDERLDAWATSLGTLPFIDRNIVGGGIAVPDHFKNGIMRNYDTNRHILTILGDEFGLQSVSQELSRIRKKAESLLK